MTDRVKGPASYFPSIEAKYGKPIAQWKAVMRDSGLTSHKDLVDWLKTEHGMGHGHANALTAHLLAEGTPRASADELIASLFTGKKAHWRALYDDLSATITKLGGVTVLPKKATVGFATTYQFAMLTPGTPERFDVGLKLPGAPTDGRLELAGSWNTLMTHRVRITDAGQADEQLRHWLAEAHRRTLT